MTQGEKDQGTTFAPEAPSANEEESDPTGDVGVTCGRVDVARVAGAGVSGGERLSGRAGVGGGGGSASPLSPLPPFSPFFFPSFFFLTSLACFFSFRWIKEQRTKASAKQLVVIDFFSISRRVTL